MYIGNNKIGG
jgi:hypothetical protein